MEDTETKQLSAVEQEQQFEDSMMNQIDEMMNDVDIFGGSNEKTQETNSKATQQNDSGGEEDPKFEDLKKAQAEAWKDDSKGQSKSSDEEGSEDGNDDDAKTDEGNDESKTEDGSEGDKQDEQQNDSEDGLKEKEDPKEGEKEKSEEERSDPEEFNEEKLLKEVESDWGKQAIKQLLLKVSDGQNEKLAEENNLNKRQAEMYKKKWVLARNQYYADNYEKTTQCKKNFTEPQSEILTEAGRVLKHAGYEAKLAEDLVEAKDFDAFCKDKQLEQYQKTPLYNAWTRYNQLEEAKKAAAENVRKGVEEAEMPLVVTISDMDKAFNDALDELEESLPIIAETKVQGENHPEYQEFYKPALKVAAQALYNMTSIANDPTKKNDDLMKDIAKMPLQNVFLERELKKERARADENQVLADKQRKLRESVKIDPQTSSKSKPNEGKKAKDSAQGTSGTSMSWDEFNSMDFTEKLFG